jgi:hypothetical protein
MNLETKIIIYKFTPQVFTLTHLNGNYTIELNQELNQELNRNCNESYS